MVLRGLRILNPVHTPEWASLLTPNQCFWFSRIQSPVFLKSFFVVANLVLIYTSFYLLILNIHLSHLWYDKNIFKVFLSKPLITSLGLQLEFYRDTCIWTNALFSTFIQLSDLIGHKVRAEVPKEALPQNIKTLIPGPYLRPTESDCVWMWTKYLYYNECPYVESQMC